MEGLQDPSEEHAPRSRLINDREEGRSTALRPLLSVVVPFFNPGARLLPTLNDIRSVLEQEHISYEIIAVSDGSTDESLAAADTVTSQTLTVLAHPRNLGKGEALRTGMSKSSGTWIAFIDADGDIPPSLLPRVLDQARSGDFDAVVGSKRHLLHHRNFGIPASRRALSLIWQAMVRVLFNLPVGDSQTGIKVFRRNVIEAALPHTTLTGFAFDLELLVTSADLGYAKMAEIPVTLAERSSSTVSLRRTACMFRDILFLFAKTRVRQTSHHVPTPSHIVQ